MSKYENKFAKLQKKAAEFNFRNQLKQTKKKEFEMEEENKVSAHLWCISFLTVSLIRHFSFLVSTGRKGRSDRHVEEGRQGRQEGKRWWRRRFGGRGRQSLRQQTHTQPFMFAPPPTLFAEDFSLFFSITNCYLSLTTFLPPWPPKKSIQCSRDTNQLFFISKWTRSLSFTFILDAPPDKIR